jgi:hypothetical protein
VKLSSTVRPDSLFSKSIKKWKCPEGTFVHNFPGHEAIINTLSVNEEGVLFSGGQSVLEASIDSFD